MSDYFVLKPTDEDIEILESCGIREYEGPPVYRLMGVPSPEDGLKPCRRCGNETPKVWKFSDSDASFWIECDRCGTRTQRKKSEMAIEDWNNGRVYDNRPHSDLCGMLQAVLPRAYEGSHHHRGQIPLSGLLRGIDGDGSSSPHHPRGSLSGLPGIRGMPFQDAPITRGVNTPRCFFATILY